MKILDIVLVIMIVIGILFIISGYKTKFLPDDLDIENFDIFNENNDSKENILNEKNRVGFFYN